MKLPKSVYVYVENEGDEKNEFLAAAADTDGAASELAPGEKRRVGRYVLEETLTLSVKVEAKAG